MNLPSPPRALLLDMDGTITRPMLDFPQIKAEMGIGQRPILEALAEMTAAKHAAAEEVLLRHEREAAMRCELNAGCIELLQLLDERGIARALITRNSRASVDTVLGRHHLRFELLLTRETGQFKPSPEPLLTACRVLGVKSGDAWMVGDGQYDVEAGLAAGCPTVWVSHGLEKPFPAQPGWVVRDLVELTALLRSCLNQ